MIVPTAASWNVLATIERETREHEAGHAAAAILLGFEVGSITLDRWADWGEFGSVRFKWSGVIDDDEELAFARAVVAAAGPFVTDAWGLGRSRQDQLAVDELRFPAWSPASWEFVVLVKTERLVRAEPFRSLHRRIVAALERIGDVGTLSGDELCQVLASIPDADLLPGEPRIEATTSARRRLVHSAAKGADADGEPGPPGRLGLSDS